MKKEVVVKLLIHQHSRTGVFMLVLSGVDNAEGIGDAGAKLIRSIDCS